MEIDVIILSYAKEDSIVNMNNQCIDSINDSTTEHKFNIILVETESTKTYKYYQDNVTVIQPNEEFNYNRFLNIALQHCKNEWVLISNNDTIYYKNFVDEMLRANEFDKELLSMSPMDDEWYIHKKNFDKTIDIHYGYRTSYEITGWSILVKKEVLDRINGFDEQFKFWYQDNDYALTLLHNKIKHALITRSKVSHLLSKSHDFIERSKRFEMTDGMMRNFTNKWKTN
jgi:GT2 family glycosyltransferase